MKSRKQATSSISSSSSAEEVASIDDLLMQIFQRLPIKPLIRFKLVSKHWHSLISTPLDHPTPALGIFFQSKTVKNVRKSRYYYIPISPKSRLVVPPPPFSELPNTDIFILHSCNGLLLCVNFWFVYDENESRFYVYNPTTYQLSTLPNPHVSRFGLVGMSLSFNPAKSRYYKAICVELLGNDLYQFLVYDSETRGPWRRCGAPFLARGIYFHNGVYWNGAIHWIERDHCVPRDNRDDHHHPIYFNPDDYDDRINVPYKKMPNTPLVDDPDWRCLANYFGESSGHLHYITFVKVSTGFDVYEMRRDYSEWFLKYRVDTSPLADAFNIRRDDSNWWWHNGMSLYTIIRGPGDRDEEDSALIFRFKRKVIRYSFFHKTCETIHDFRYIEAPGRLLHENGFHYIESLSSV